MKRVSLLSKPSLSWIQWITLLSSTKDYLLGLFDGDSLNPIPPVVPRHLRLLFILVLILNSRSLPFAWHLRTFKPALYIRTKELLLHISARKKKEVWLDTLSPIGKSPFSLKETYETWASLDESDWNVHLSNSSYAKALDVCRVKFAAGHLSTLYRDGCWMALGANHLKFIREIRLGARYEIRMYVGSWESKWMYIIARFVSKGRGKRTSGNASTPQMFPPTSRDVVVSTPPKLALMSPAEFDSLWSEAPGETLHCIAINEVCFKRGRVTIPPAVVLASAGCGLSPEKWAEVKQIRADKRMRELLVGGWRNVPEKERWWEEAMNPFEEERVRRLGLLKNMREELEVTRLL